MDSPDKALSELVDIVKSWVPWRSEPSHLSRDFWMPDKSCRVCYECDIQFTIFNRRHHCRLCGRVFCSKCTPNSIPASSDRKPSWEEWDKIRVCNYCFKQWEQGIDNGVQISSSELSTSPSAGSLASTKSSGTAENSCVILAPMPYPVEPCQHVPISPVLSLHQPPRMETNMNTDDKAVQERSTNSDADLDLTLKSYCFSLSRSDDEYDGYNVYQVDQRTTNYSQANDFFGQVGFHMIDSGYGSPQVHPIGDIGDTKSSGSSPLLNSFNSHILGGSQQLVSKEAEHDVGDECEAPSSLYAAEDINAEPVDFENNGLLWLPPEPEDEDDEREVILSDDDDGDGTGEWGYLGTSSSFGSGEFRNRHRSIEEHKQVMKNVVDDHFRALVSQLLQVENLPLGEEDDKESWLEIITSLSWDAATFLKPDMSKGGGMDPGGYVKIKCIASGRRCESMVVKGVVCKKNVAHRRMTSRIEKPRLLILGGALEYQRVSNHLSSFDTLLQQEMDHLKMAVAKIDAHRPDVLLVEKSVSRFAQDYLLAKDISLVLNIKRPLLERLARCTGAQIVPSLDILSSQKLGYCDSFHVEKFLEEHGSAGQGGKKLVKTLMYFDGCPKPLGCTVLLRGASVDELKKVKHVLQYGIFAAYHLALETSFLADEGASLPELPLNSPLTVTLPDQPSIIERSISTFPGFIANEKPEPQPIGEPLRSNSVPLSINDTSVNPIDLKPSPSLPDGSCFEYSQLTADLGKCTVLGSAIPPLEQVFSEEKHNQASTYHMPLEIKIPRTNKDQSVSGDEFIPSEETEQNVTTTSESQCDSAVTDSRNQSKDPSEDFPPSPSDHLSILVSLSSRCVWKGTVCVRSHLFRIRYYSNFDKPLGRFLRDHLFDQSYRCRFCDMPSEAHVHCYTHLQGTLTISVKMLSEFLLPGERDGKIWMWHRCSRCPRINGFPPATRRVVMSDAAWGLSFGKFLELSFSDHAAASRVASCGHSLHRDCLRFYGFGKMVACFRYASIDVHSVYLPRLKLGFNYEHQEWIQKEADEVKAQAELLFSEVLNALCQISQKGSGTGSSPELRHQIIELEGMLQREKTEFEESFEKVINGEVKKDQPIIDILEINWLRRQLIFQSYMWDHRLVYVARLDKNRIHDGLPKNLLEHGDKTEFIDEKQTGNGVHDTLLDANNSESSDREEQFLCKVNHADLVHQGADMTSENQSAGINVSEQSDSPECGTTAHRAPSDEQFPAMENLSVTLDEAWTGENHTRKEIEKDSFDTSGSPMQDFPTVVTLAERSDLEDHMEDGNGVKMAHSHSHLLLNKSADNSEDSASWLKMPFLNFYHSLNKNFLGSAQKFDTLGEYNPVYISSFQEIEHQGGARLLLPMGVNDTTVPIFDDEPTSVISYALVSQDYHLQLSDEKKPKDVLESMTPLPYTDHSFHSSNEIASESFRSTGSLDESVLSTSGSRSSLILDPFLYTKTMHARISFEDDSPLGKVKYTVTCYYAKRFETLRRICCPSELDFIRSLSRCKKWGAQGGKSNVFFAKTLDDRFIVKQVTKTELESFIKFAPAYFKYLSESILSGSPTCLAKILGIYQVTTKYLKGGKESKMDVLVMENLLFERHVTRLYDLKGSSRSRYNPDSRGSNKVLLDQNLIEAMPTSPIFVGNRAKRLLERAVWNDTSFLASVDVMDYSLLVGVDEKKNELVLGIIDFMRQYTWDKHLETWVKASGILGGLKNSSPTIISPKQYKKRFRKAMTTYFLMVPDQWSPPVTIPSRSSSDACEENAQE